MCALSGDISTVLPYWKLVEDQNPSLNHLSQLMEVLVQSVSDGVAKAKASEQP